METASQDPLPTAGTPGDTSPAVKSALRVFDLLEFFAEWRRPATVSEICLSVGWPQSSTSVLLRSLADSSYLDHDPRMPACCPANWQWIGWRGYGNGQPSRPFP